MLWRLIDINHEAIQAFRAVLDDGVAPLSSATFSRISYTLISQARLAFALLDLLDPPAVDDDIRSNGNANGWQPLTPKQVIEQINYDNSCSSLVAKLESAASGQRGGTGVDALRHFSLLVPSMLASYTRKLQARMASSAVEGSNRKGLEPDAGSGGQAFNDRTFNSILRDFKLPPAQSATKFARPF